jgi:2-C-methyl-D-erythritol 4-phosphate cytidylyltransferase
MARVWGVVVAGGSASRFGVPKQFASLGGRPVVEWAVSACRSVCERVVLVLPADIVAAEPCPRFGADLVVSGGETRSASVRAGLAALGSDAAVVVVHDAARPLAGPSLFRAVVDLVDVHGLAGAICAVAVTDTLKRVNAQAERPTLVTETLDRASLVAVQTPQAFMVEVLRRAHLGDPQATDDAALVEALGEPVGVVPGDPDNLKLTTPADLDRAALLAHG